MRIYRLTDSMINRIAAGEVVERPASAVKELIENAVDAGATRIELVTAGGGKRLIRVTDDGTGMTSGELRLAVERHCTSKLTEDLLDIRTLGFRGEALPSIGSVARLFIRSRAAGSGEAWAIEVDNGLMAEPLPAALSKGTVVEVRDLFQRVPARLKFMKTDRAESAAITDIFKRMALAFPQVHFVASGEDRTSLDFPRANSTTRIAQVLGSEFADNAVEIDAEREGVSLAGLISLPTYNRGNALNQFFFVNGRPVRDKQLMGALKGAYSDFLPRDRHPVAVLFIMLSSQEVDVNVHPAKADVRFRDPGLVRALLVGSIRRAISEGDLRASTVGAAGMAAGFRPGDTAISARALVGAGLRPSAPAAFASQWNAPQGFAEPKRADGHPDGFGEEQSVFHGVSMPSGKAAEAVAPETANGFPLGAARCQVHENYIIAQTEKGLVIVDQHAAHERIVYEALKKGLERGVASQVLLIPEIVDLPEEDAAKLLEAAPDLARLGFVIEPFGPGAISVRETPAMLGEVNAIQLARDLADELGEWGTADGLENRLFHVAATMACHGSVRSGRALKSDEMNALLRQMENTPNAGQCNHGRPTFVELGLKDIERLFGR